MKLAKLGQKIMNDFMIVFASIILIITLLRQMYYPHLVFDLNSIYIIMTCSFLSAILRFILYAPNDISERNARIRIALHFFSLEILLIIFGSVLGIVNSKLDVIILALQIALIYSLVRLLSWQSDKKEATKINERLNELKKIDYENQ